MEAPKPVHTVTQQVHGEQTEVEDDSGEEGLCPDRPVRRPECLRRQGGPRADEIVHPEEYGEVHGCAHGVA